MKSLANNIKFRASMFCLIVSLMFFSCERKQPKALPDKQSLLNGLINDHNIDCYLQLWDVYCELGMSPGEFMSYSLFAADSLHYLPGYGLMTYYYGDTDIFYSAIELVNGQSAYYTIVDTLSINHTIREWILRNKTFSPWGEETDLSADSLLKLLAQSQNIDDAYYSLRRNIPLESRVPIAQMLADCLGYAPAACDVYLSLIQSNYPFMADEKMADSALHYLMIAEEKHFKPAIFYKSLMLLTGTYLPQDTIRGQELLMMCQDSICKIPFWRGKLKWTDNDFY